MKTKLAEEEYTKQNIPQMNSLTHVVKETLISPTRHKVLWHFQGHEELALKGQYRLTGFEKSIRSEFVFDVEEIRIVGIHKGTHLEHLHRSAVLSQIPATWGIYSGHSDVCKFCEGAAITPQIIALKLRNLLELQRGRRTQSPMCCSARESRSLYNAFFRREELIQTQLEGLTSLVRAIDWIL
jgi:hypothetical protein